MKAAAERWLEMRARLTEGEIRLPSDADLMRDLMFFGRSASFISFDESGTIPVLQVERLPPDTRWFVTWGSDVITALIPEPDRNGCPTCGCDECGCKTRRKPMGCYVDDCEGCRCATSPMPPCGHCETHGIDLEPCALCGCETCGCTEERVDMRDRAAAYPELVP